MGVLLELLRRHLLQLELYVERRVARCKAGAIGNAKNVCVDSDGGRSERRVQDDVGGLPTHTR